MARPGVPIASWWLGQKSVGKSHSISNGPQRITWTWEADVGAAKGQPHEFHGLSELLIPTVIDQNPCAHLRMPRDMIFHGWSMRLFQAWQHSATMSS